MYYVNMILEKQMYVCMFIHCCVCVCLFMYVYINRMDSYK